LRWVEKKLFNGKACQTVRHKHARRNTLRVAGIQKQLSSAMPRGPYKMNVLSGGLLMKANRLFSTIL